MSVEEIARLDEIICDNLDLIPVANWGFGQNVLDDLKRVKHFQTNKQLSRAEKKSLNKHQKQKIARGLGSIHHVVSELIEQMKSSQFADVMPRNPKRKFNNEPEVKDITKSAEAIELKVEDKEISDGKRRKIECDSQRPLKKTEKNEKLKSIRERKAGKAKSVQNNVSSEKAKPTQNNGLFENSKKQGEDSSQKAKSAQNSISSKKAKPAHNNISSDKTAKKTADKKVEEDIKPMECDETINLDDTNEGDACEAVESGLVDSNMILPATTGPKKGKNGFRGRDYGRLLVKAEKRNEKLDSIRERNPEKAKSIENNIQWDRAMKKAAGEKVKDNVDLLKKGLKRKLKQKQKSKKDWSMRAKNVDDKKQKKQNRREMNIKKRKDEKIKFQQKRRLKKGT